MKKVVALMVFVLIAAGAFGQESNYMGGQWLVDNWKAYQKTGSVTLKEAMEAGGFVGFVMGVADMGNGHQILAIPTDITTVQVVAVVGKSLDDHPEWWNQPAEILVESALGAVWPGPKNRDR